MFSVTAKLTGKITDPNLNRETKTAIEEGLLEIATIEGQVGVQKQLYPGHGFVTGNLFKHIGSALVGPMTAQFDAGQNRYGKNLVYAGWIEGISSKNKKSSFKGYGMFGKTTKALKSKTNLWNKYISPRLMKVFD